MKLSAIQIEAYELPFLRPIITSKATFTLRKGWWISFVDEFGNIGTGEAAPWPGFGCEEDKIVIKKGIQTLSKITLLQNWTSWEKLADAILENISLKNTKIPSPLTFAIETAAASLFAQQQRISLAKLLNPSHKKSLSCAKLVLDPKDALDAVKKGFTCLKIKVGKQPVLDEIAHVKKIREIVGNKISLRLDANQAWNLQQANQFLSAIKEQSISFIEEPLKPSISLAELDHSISIAADERIINYEKAVELIKFGVRILVLKPMFCGGIRETIRIAKAASKTNVSLVVTHALDSTIGQMAARQLAATLPGDLLACGFSTVPIEEKNWIERPKNGHITIEDKPGLGLSLFSSDKSSSLFTPFSPYSLPIPVISCAIAYPDKEAIQTSKGSWNYRQLAAHVSAIGRTLSAIGVSIGTRVGIIGPPSKIWIATLHAIGFVGGIAVPIHEKWTKQERKQHFNITNPDLVVDLTKTKTISFKTPKITIYCHNDSTWLSPCQFNQLNKPIIESTYEPTYERFWPLDEERLLITTSGTTGSPKPVYITTGQLVFSAFGSATRLGTLPNDRWLLVLPLHHIGGLSVLYRAAFYGTSVLLQERFNAENVAEALIKGVVSHVSLVPVMLSRVLDALAEKNISEKVRVILLGGSRASKTLLQRAKNKNLPIAITWGMSETASQIATQFLTKHDKEEKNELVGTPLPFGRVSGKAPFVVHGPIARGKHITSDVGIIKSSGELRIDGRIDDVFISGGENVQISEIEDCLQQHPLIHAVAVIAIKDPTWGKRPVAFIESDFIESDPILCPNCLKKWCKERLSSQKIPDKFFLVKKLPRNQLGKVMQKKLLRYVFNKTM